MQVFKTFMKVLRKKMGYALMFICIFLGIAFPMSFNADNSGNTREMFLKESKSSVELCIFDEDKTPESQAFIDYLSEKYTIKTLKNDDEVIMDSLFYMVVDRVITVNKGFSEKLADGDIEGIVDSRCIHESYEKMLLDQDINSYFSAVSAYLAGGENTLSASEKASEALMTDAEINIISFDESGNSEYSKAFSGYFRYMAYILMAAVIGTLCPILMVMNKKELRFRTNCSSLQPSSYTKQIFLGCALFIMGVWGIFMIAGMIIYGGIYEGRAWLAVLNSFIYSMVAVSITVLLSTFCTNINILNFINQIISLGMSFTCGVFVSHDLLDKGVLSFARFLPAYWYIKVNMMLDGTEVFDSVKLAQYLIIEAAFVVVFALIVLVAGKAKYNSAAIFKGNKRAVAN